MLTQEPQRLPGLATRRLVLVNQEKVRWLASFAKRVNGCRFLLPRGSLNTLPVVPGRCGGEWSE